MRARALILIVLLPLLSCSRKPVHGLQYSFASDVEAEGVQDADLLRGMKGKAFTDGTFTRLEIEQGDGKLFKSGTVYISEDGGDHVAVLSTGAKSWYRYDAEEYEKSVSVAAIPKLLANIDVMNVKAFVDDLGSDREMQGHKTHRYTMNMTFDLRMIAGGRSHTANTVTRSRIWTTDEIDEKYFRFLNRRQVRSGIKEVDDKVAAAAKEISGFPLRQIVDTELRMGDDARAMRSTLRVFDIEEKDLQRALFDVPDDYEKVKAPEPEQLTLR